MYVPINAIERAIDKAAKNNKDKPGMPVITGNKKFLAAMVQDDIKTGRYKSRLKHRKLIRRNTNGKLRHIDSPDSLTSVYQHVWLQLAKPYYDKHDNFNGLNCKEGCGITARDKTKSVIKKLKHAVYDRRDLNYFIIIDQRKCYPHIKPKIFRKEAKFIIPDRCIIDYGIDVGFVDNDLLPIGTSTSPLIHNIVMLRFDHFCKQIAPWSIRYADDCILAARTLEEANAIVWRIKNFWWYELQIRAKSAVQIIPADKAISYCGYVLHRHPNKSICDNNKGRTGIRANIRLRAMRCKSNEPWGSYYGIMHHADCFHMMLNIERRMNLRSLTDQIKIDRKMDAKRILMQDLIGKYFNLIEYEIRHDVQNKFNWIKCLIGIPEFNAEGLFTGRYIAREFHGNYRYLIAYLQQLEQVYGDKKNFLPIENARIIESCGYIFEGSTNQLEYIQ